MSALADDDEPFLNFDGVNNNLSAFRSCAPSGAFSATASTRSLATPSQISQPLGLPITTITRLTHDKLTHNPEFMKYVEMVSHLQELLSLRRNPTMAMNSTTISSTTTSSLRPSESASQVSSGSARLQSPLPSPRPLICPDCYPPSVIWTQEDCKADPAVGCLASNQSRPPMQHAVQHEDGVMISELEWKDIRQSAAIIACSHMEPLKQHPRAVVGKMHKKGFVKKTFPDVWYEALIALERSAPSLSLCALNWKADMVLGAVLDKPSDPVPPSRPSTPSLITSSRPPPSSLVTSSRASASRALASHPSTPSSVAPPRPSQLSPRRASFKSPHPRPRALSGPVQSPQEPKPAGKAGPQAKHRHDPSPSQRNGKRSKVGEGASGTSAGSSAVQHQPPSPRPAFMSLVQPDTASQLPPSSEPALPKTSRAKQDNAMSRAKAPSTRAKGKGKDNPASPRWGAQVQVRLATSSFENSSEPAPPKTTRSKQGHATSRPKAPSTRSAKAKGSCPTMTDDDDVATQSQSKSRLVMPVSDPRCKSPRWGAQDPAGKAALLLLLSSEDSGSDDDSHSHLQALQHDELVLWVEEHKIESQGKRPTRRDLIDAIAGAPKSEQPSKEDIEGIIKERKSKRITKAA
ncbi:hypothetical protein EDB89DRAFT_2073330 [Lactarius sanguifluus]|nr:hypothetical protein EDB89DRAFT_2073330 [Lactarius sanguifluus]